MVRQACTLFEALATERPLVLVLEDLHWADFATIDFISALCRRRSSAKLMLIGTYRPEALRAARHPLKKLAQDLALHNYCSEIELAPLSAPAISEVLSGGAESELVSADFTRLIEERTEGNPLLMRVTLDYLCERGEISRTPRGWRPLVPLGSLSSEAPPSLARAIAAKIEGMTDERRRVLEAASAAGLRFDPATTMRAAGMDEQSLEAICEDLSRNTNTIHRDELLILPNGDLVRCYAFNHAVCRQVVYDGIGQSRRSLLHRAIADRLEEIYPPDQRGDLATRLAQHLASAREWPRALIYLRSALRVAIRRYASRDALAILELASELTANLSDNDRISAEIEFLERRSAILLATHDVAARETYAQLAARAARLGDIDTQCRALIGLAVAAAWHDLTYSVRILDQILLLCEKQSDPIQRDLTRMTAYVQRLWQSGWNRTDARKCEEALARLEASGGRLAIASAQAHLSMLCLVSARYREVVDLVTSSHRLLVTDPQNLVEGERFWAWMLHIGVPWSLFSLGEFSAALNDLDAGIATFETNSEPALARYLRVYRGALSFHVMNFERVLQDCGPVADKSFEQDAGSTILPIERRIALIFCGLAEAALGNNVVALGHLHSAEDEMERQPVHLDWYWRLALNWGIVNVRIAEGNHSAALERAKQLCDLAERTDERAWQALAWEAQARANLLSGKMAEAADCAAGALAACDGVQVPIAEWRVHATSAMVYKAGGDIRRATRHNQLGAAVRKRLAESLPEGDPVRLKFEQRSGALAEV
jgi:hypothetical protein